LVTALGFWKALDEVWPKTRAQRCWVHKTANSLNKLPKSLHGKAKRALRDIWMAETRKDAEAAFHAFIESYGRKYDKAADSCARTATRCSPSTTSRPSTGSICARPIRSRALSRPCGTERSDRRGVSPTRPRSP
jgi:transposase-like protein